jgi:hypothetical protein
MLTAEQLSEAIREAEKAASVCGRLCRTGGAIEQNTMTVFHNGLGDSDSDEQHVHSTIALALAQPAWQQRLEAWLRRLHEHRRFCLNEGKEL